jgi:putative ABC transport system permease protein
MLLLNHVKIAWRNLTRRRAYTAINLLGLGLGIGCATLVFALVRYHLSFDTFHADTDRIFRVVTEQHRDQVSYTAGTPAPLGDRFRADFSFAEHTARAIVLTEQAIAVKVGREVRKFNEPTGIACVEPDFFRIFHFPLVQGSAALAEPNTLLLSERLARKYFGTTNVVGKTLRWKNEVDLRIVGVLTDPPATTDLPYELYTAFQTIKASKDGFLQWLVSPDSWGGIYTDSYCFVKLKPGVSATTVERALIPFADKYRNAKAAKNRFNRYRLQPLRDVHFNADFGGRVQKKYLLTLGLLGLMLIVTACLNFINLATAQALGRSKEVGVRKVLGGQRQQLLGQFLAETALLVGCASVLGYAVAEATLPFVNDWFRARIDLNLLGNGALGPFLLGLAALVTLLAGTYPGLVLAGFQPIVALRGHIGRRHVGGFSLRQVLVAGQLVIAQLLIIGTLVVTQQMRYAEQTDLGFSKEAVVLLPIPDVNNIGALRNQLAQLPAVRGLTMCAATPASNHNFTTGFEYDNRPDREAYPINIKHADEHYLGTFSIRLVAGRNFAPSEKTGEYLINETTVRKLGLPSAAAALGKPMRANGEPGRIVGVVKDFHNLSFHEAIEPVCITPEKGQYQTCAVKLNLADVPGRGTAATLAALERTWNAVYADYPYSYEFLDDHIGRFYEQESLILRLIQVFAFIAILIGCLGLYGLVSFVVVQRTKEIGVRKVLGASVAGIVWQLDRQFVGLVLVAFVLAAPLASWAMNAWLAGFTYRIALGPGTFGLAVLSTLGLTGLVVGYQSLRAALMNPVKSLRSE